MSVASIFRSAISVIVVGAISIGNSVQIALSSDVPLTKWQIWSAVIGGTLLMLNDVKSRLTPVEVAEPDKPEAKNVIVAP